MRLTRILHIKNAFEPNLNSLQRALLAHRAAISFTLILSDYFGDLLILLCTPFSVILYLFFNINQTINVKFHLFVFPHGMNAQRHAWLSSKINVNFTRLIHWKM